MSFRHAEGFGSKIEKFSELDPGMVMNTAPSSDLGKQITDGIHDAGDAVHKADEATATVDKAKNLLGFWPAP